MRIAIFPAHPDDSAASARIRAFTLAKSLMALGHDVRMRDATGAEVVFVQKRVTPATVDVVRDAKRSGALIVYDVDDLGRDLWYFVAPRVLHRLLALIDVVTTDTSAHRDLLLRDYGIDQVAVVPDAIDYYPTGPVRPAITDAPPLRVLWFGNVANIRLFEKYANVLAGTAEVELVAITNASAIERLAERLPRVRFLRWSRNDFVAMLQSCALSILPHDGTENDRAKSNNRMIASITWGVPALVSRTPDYERTAVDAGVPEAVFDGAGELTTIVEHFRSAAARTAYLDTAQPDIWRRYSPEAVARRFMEVVDSAPRKQRVTARPGYLRWLYRASHGRVASPLLMEAMHIASRIKHGRAAA